MLASISSALGPSSDLPPCRKVCGSRSSSPSVPASALSWRAALVEPVRLISLARSNSTDIAIGVLKSSPMASAKRFACGSSQSTAQPPGCVSFSAVYRRVSAWRASSRCASL
ncbi:hypothetical protein D3C81_1401640 [compost metagenome]